MSLRLKPNEARVLFARMNKVYPMAQRKDLKKVVARANSSLEVIFLHQIDALHLPRPSHRNLRFCPDRKFELDFVWHGVEFRTDLQKVRRTYNLAFEVQGMAHRIKERFKSDTEKFALAVIYGWRVVPVSGDDIRSGRAVAWLTTLLGAA